MLNSTQMQLTYKGAQATSVMGRGVWRPLQERHADALGLQGQICCREIPADFVAQGASNRKPKVNGNLVTLKADPHQR